MTLCLLFVLFFFFFTQTETFPSWTDAEKLQNEPESNEMKCPI